MSIYVEGYIANNGWDEERQKMIGGRKVGKPLGPDAPHYPNKAERVLLTQMMQKSGQTEEQIRAIKSNRRKLAVAAQSMMKSQNPQARREYEVKMRRRKEAAWLGLEVWELQQKNEAALMSFRVRSIGL